MNGMYTHRLKWWAWLALKIVSMHRRVSGQTSFDRVVEYCLSKGFTPR
jgi:hypothetical protein